MREPRVSLQETTEEISQNDVDNLTKLDNRKSRFASKSLQKKNFMEQVRDHAEDNLDKNQKMFQLGLRYLEIMKDQTLPENRGPIEKNIEQEVLGNLVNFAVQINNDDNEPEGNGSMAIINLLLKTALINRDNQNKALFKISLLEKEIRELKVELKNANKQRKDS